MRAYGVAKKVSQPVKLQRSGPSEGGKVAACVAYLQRVGDQVFMRVGYVDVCIGVLCDSFYS